MTEEQFNQIKGVRCAIHMRDGMKATGKVRAEKEVAHLSIFGTKYLQIVEIYVEHYGSLRTDSITRIDRAEGI